MAGEYFVFLQFVGEKTRSIHARQIHVQSACLDNSNIFSARKRMWHGKHNCSGVLRNEIDYRQIVLANNPTIAKAGSFLQSGRGFKPILFEQISP